MNEQAATARPAWFTPAAALLLLAGILLSGYSLLHHVRLAVEPDAGPAFCNINEALNCDVVNSSEYATLFGIPLASYGLLFYFVLLILLVFGARLAGRRLVHLQFVAALFAVAFSLYLFIISEFVIGTLCIICIGLYLVNGGLLLTTWLAGRGDSFAQRWAVAWRAVWQLPAALMGGAGEPARRSAMLGLVAVVLAAIGVWRLPQSIAAWLEGAQETSEVEVVVSQALQEWRHQPVDSLELQLEAGVDIDYAKGNPLAPVQIVEFSDLECPACRYFYRVFNELMEEFPGQIHLVHRNFPLDHNCNPSMEGPMHENACFLALFSRCAGEQGRHWEMLDFIYGLEAIDEQAPPAEVRRALFDEARAQGLDVEGLTECLEAPRQREKLLDDIRTANELGLMSTPTIWINNRRLLRNSPRALAEIVAYILAEEGA